MRGSVDFLPLFHDVRGANALVVGGGTVASRKIRALLSRGATVTVVATELSRIPRLARRPSRPASASTRQTPTTTCPPSASTIWSSTLSSTTDRSRSPVSPLAAFSTASQ